MKSFIEYIKEEPIAFRNTSPETPQTSKLPQIAKDMEQENESNRRLLKEPESQPHAVEGQIGEDKKKIKEDEFGLPESNGPLPQFHQVAPSFRPPSEPKEKEAKVISYRDWLKNDKERKETQYAPFTKAWRS